MENKIICVDLDGSLVLTDTLHETAIAAFKKNIFIVFKIFYWLLVKGRVYCKKQLSGSIDVSTLHLPVNQPLLLWLKKQKEAGCKLYLVTAADQKIADTIAKQIPIFETAFGTNWDLNLSGISKRDFLDQQFGSRQYVYVGNGRCDLTVFAHAAEAVVVNNSPHFIEKVKKITPVSIVFKTSMNNFSTFLKALRIHQYAKNLLIFLPLLLGHEINNAPLILSTVLGFICFSLIASSAYLLNDVLDLPSDRLHPTKRFRPVASGELSISYALLGMAVNFMAGVVLALEWLPSVFCIALISYYIITVAYSFKLKKLLLVDVFALAILYTTRIVAGMT
ncbi:MAG: UbiA prenyltransferase, partial [uncultured bacterium]